MGCERQRSIRGGGCALRGKSSLTVASGLPRRPSSFAFSLSKYPNHAHERPRISRVRFGTQCRWPQKQKNPQAAGLEGINGMLRQCWWWCSSPLEETALPHRQGHHRRDCTPCGSPGRVLPSPHISATAERETTSALRWVACVFRPLVPEHESRCTPQGTAKLLPTSTATRSPHHPSIRDRPTRKLAKVSTEV